MAFPVLHYELFLAVDKILNRSCLIYPLTCKQWPSCFAWTCLAGQEAGCPWNNTPREATWHFARMCCATANLLLLWIITGTTSLGKMWKHLSFIVFLESAQRCLGYCVNFKLLWVILSPGTLCSTQRCPSGCWILLNSLLSGLLCAASSQHCQSARVPTYMD